MSSKNVSKNAMSSPAAPPSMPYLIQEETLKLPVTGRGPQLLLDRGQCRLQIGQLGFRLAAPEQTFIRIGPVNRFAHFFQGVGG